MAKETSTPLPQDLENWVSFKNRLKVFPKIWGDRIDFAYDLAKDIHKPYFRKDGVTRYFEHPRSVAIILLDECKIRDPRIIVAALLHDTVEDTVVFGNYDGVSYSQWIQRARKRVTPYFGTKVADMVIALTKPKIDEEEIKSKEEAMAKYFENLSLNPDAILIKMADRLHNLRDSAVLSVEERIKIVEETQTLYFPLFEKARVKYPREYRAMIGKMQDAIRAISII